jgi:hypothetical protein
MATDANVKLAVMVYVTQYVEEFHPTGVAVFMIVGYGYGAAEFAITGPGSP